MTQFNASVFQNEYLPDGGNVVDAVVTVTAVEGQGAAAPQPSVPIVEVIAVDVSGSMNEDGGAKIRAARDATIAAIDALEPGVLFAIIAGNHEAKALYPPRGGLAEVNAKTQQEARDAASRSMPTVARPLVHGSVAQPH